jgi:hypothetical protein
VDVPIALKGKGIADNILDERIGEQLNREAQSLLLVDVAFEEIAASSSERFLG